MRLPAYDPPNLQSASMAAGAAPLLVLVTFTLIVTRLIDPATGFAAFLACTLWVVHEMHLYQKTIDAYNADYVRRHLAWRSSETLEALIRAESEQSPTRDFVQRFLGAGRVLMRDGPSIRVGG